MDLMMAQDLTGSGQCELSNISTDKRSLKETQQFYIDQIAFDLPFTLRVFTVNDAVQLKIKDMQEHIFVINLCELPLSIDKNVTQYFQLGTKQIQL